MSAEAIKLVVYALQMPNDDHVLIYFTNERVIIVQTKLSLGTEAASGSVTGTVKGLLGLGCYLLTGPVGIGVADMLGQKRKAKHASKRAGQFSGLSVDEILEENKRVMWAPYRDYFVFVDNPKEPGMLFGIDDVVRHYRWRIQSVPDHENMGVNEIIDLMKATISDCRNNPCGSHSLFQSRGFI